MSQKAVPSPPVPQNPLRSSTSPWVLFLLMAVGSVISFGVLIQSYFQEDDFALLSAVSKGDPFGAWTHHGAPFFRPLVSVSYWVQYNLFGLDPVAYRLFNDLVHAGCALAVTLLTAEFLPRKVEFQRIPVFAGILFLISPTHVEAVNWLCARTDLLATLFGLFGFLFFIQFVKDGNRVRLLLSSVFVLIGLFAKESIILLPVGMGIFLVLTPGKKKALPLLLLGTTLAIYLAVHILTVGINAGSALDRVHGIKLLLFSLVQFGRTVVPAFPFSNVPEANLAAMKTPLGLCVFVVGLVLSLGPLLYVKQFLGKREWLTLVGLVLVSWLPVVGLSVHLLTTDGERYLYLPSVPIFISLAMAASGLKRPLQLAATLIVPLYLVNLTWQNVLWKQAATTSKNAAFSFANDVAPNVQRVVVLACVPGQLRGSGFGLVYQYGRVAELLTHRKISVEAEAIVDSRSSSHRIGCFVFKGQPVLRSLDHGGDFDQITAMGTTGGDRNVQIVRDLSNSLRTNQVDVISRLPAIPTFFWDGSSFVRIPINHIRRSGIKESNLADIWPPPLIRRQRGGGSLVLGYDWGRAVGALARSRFGRFLRDSVQLQIAGKGARRILLAPVSSSPFEFDVL